MFDVVGCFPSFKQWCANLGGLYRRLRFFDGRSSLLDPTHTRRTLKWSLSIVIALLAGSELIEAIDVTPESATYFEGNVWAPLAVALVVGSAVPNIDGYVRAVGLSYRSHSVVIPLMMPNLPLFCWHRARHVTDASSVLSAQQSVSSSGSRCRLIDSCHFTPLRRCI